MPLLDDRGPYIEDAKLMEAAGQTAIADALLAEAKRQFPKEDAVFTLRTEFIGRRGGPDAAFARWVVHMSHRFAGRGQLDIAAARQWPRPRWPTGRAAA